MSIDWLKEMETYLRGEPTQSYPTAWAYERACEALHRTQAELAFAHRRIDRLRALAGRLRYELTGRHDARRGK